MDIILYIQIKQIICVGYEAHGNNYK